MKSKGNITTNNHVCQVCKKEFEASQLFPAELIRPHIVEFIKHKIPTWDTNGFICTKDIHDFRTGYINLMIKKELGESNGLKKGFAKSIKQHEIEVENINDKYDSVLGFGDRLADNIASFGGSWRFIIIFFIILLIWIVVNTIFLTQKPFDPYPFILMNLILSCLAALQAPVIMMSQNRQETKDRIRSEHDYKINLKSELEVRLLNEKIDFLLLKQWQRLLEIQGIQTELMEEILKNKE